jgi:hypothetical protein
LIEYVDKMLRTSRPALFAPSPRQNRGYRLLRPGPNRFASRIGVKTRRQGRYGTALSPDRQTRYELKSCVGSAAS